MADEDDVAALEAQWQWVAATATQADELDAQFGEVAERVAKLEEGSDKIAELLRTLTDVERGDQPNSVPVITVGLKNIIDTESLFKDASEGSLEPLKDGLGKATERLAKLLGDVAAVEGQWPWVAGAVARAAGVDSQIQALTARIVRVEGGADKVGQLSRLLSDLERGDQPTSLPMANQALKNLMDNETLVSDALEGTIEGLKERFDAAAEKLG